ncbi:MAG: tRNA threonylcarbamoyladenosine dehydratase [Clostridia bacterium]|nr:tRNA threonylcarbamoyladenosine dehydratase [Clostridia bacterium]MBQ2272927.1 tRNA threonylcarbamoyladenosine dehydratase [Clostridia bacterium]MBQ5820299.1 tRNA threonylcarbamoyladenosine dehydratase [Clostridia bacterium]
MGNRLERTELLLGSEQMKKLKDSHVAIFGLGGVGGYAAEGLARAGVGRLTVIDCDVFSESNLNRQLYATYETVGRDKTQVTAARIASFAPDCAVTPLSLWYTPENAHTVDLTAFDYVIDAIDTMTSKIHLICACHEAGVPIISSMGTGNKTDPTALRVTDLYRTQGCPMARILRRELKKRNLPALKVVYSEEEPKKTVVPDETTTRHAPGSLVFVPACAGLILASEAVKDLLK